MCPVSLGQIGLSTVELKLADSIPFGSYEYISASLSTVYIKLLVSIADDLVAARHFLDRVHDIDSKSRDVVFRDPLIRRTIEDGVCRITEGIDTIDPTTLDELMLAAAENAVTLKLTLLNEKARCVRFSLTPGSGHIWVDDTKIGRAHV